jgi:hypothetical protein
MLDNIANLMILFVRDVFVVYFAYRTLISLYISMGLLDWTSL